MGHKLLLNSFLKLAPCGDLKTCQDRRELGLVTPADRLVLVLCGYCTEGGAAQDSWGKTD